MIRRAQSRRKNSATLLEIKSEAKRKGWLKYIRQGSGQEADERAMLDGCRFSVRRAEHVLAWFEGRKANKSKGVERMRPMAVLTEGPWAGKPFTLMDWQRDFLTRAFGWVRLSKEWKKWVRRFRYLYLEVPKKSGKTPLLANLGNYLLFADSHGRQINQFMAATTKQQAMRCLVHATRVFKYRPELRELAVTKKLEGYESIHFGDNIWQVIAADATSADGINGHVIADEFHRWKGKEFFAATRYALASQPEGLFCAITTAGNIQESVCRRAHDKTIEVNSGRQVDQQWFGTVFAADPEDSPHEEKTWFKANPSLGRTPDAPLKLTEFRADYETARKDPSQWREFLQLRLNLWQTGENSWVDINKLDAGQAARDRAEKVKVKTDELTKSGRQRYRTQPKRIDCLEPFTVDDIIEINMERIESGQDPLYAVAGLDASTVRDASAAVVAFEHWKEPGVICWLPRFWLPQNRAEDLQKEIDWRSWAEAGFVKLTPGGEIDFDTMFYDLVELFEALHVVRFYFDPGFQATWITQRLESRLGIERVAHRQTFSDMSAPMKTAELMVGKNTLRFDGNPVFAWQFGNTNAKTDANGNIRPVKPKHGDPRTIDGVVAGIMTLTDWLIVPEDEDEDGEPIIF